MDGVALRSTVQDYEGLGGALQRLRALGQSPRLIFEGIATYGEASTRLRFKTQAGPDGVKWKPSERVKQHGGQTLQHTARLLRSISNRAGASYAEWGSNVAYARIHQLGGKIERHAHSGWVRLRVNARGQLLRQPGHEHLAVFARATHKRAVTRRHTTAAYVINMPARPYLGINERDQAEMGNIALDVVDQVGGKR